jgi:Domain of unknown function (DUF4274)
MQDPLEGLSLMQIVQRLTPDDWHNFAYSWNWDSDCSELWWIAEQPNCDQSTALLIFLRGAPEYHLDPSKVLSSNAVTIRDNLLRIARQVTLGFYQNNKFGLPRNDVVRGAEILAAVQKLEIGGINLSAQLLDNTGKTMHKPIYMYDDGGIWTIASFLEMLGPSFRWGGFGVVGG